MKDAPSSPASRPCRRAGCNNNFQVFDDAKKNLLDNYSHHKKGENVNNVGFDDVEKNSLANDCHHQKGGDCECMNTGF